jgi:hypothetical protein
MIISILICLCSACTLKRYCYLVFCLSHFFQTATISVRKLSAKNRQSYFDTGDAVDDDLDSEDDNVDLDPDWQKTPIFKRIQKLKVTHLLSAYIIGLLQVKKSVLFL